MLSKTQIFINKANQKHNYFYDYSLVEYKHSKQYIDIICPIHGIFQQKPNNHLTGYGCKKCGDISSSIKQSYTLQEFSSKASKIHNNKYEYITYKNVQNKVEIKCPIHGIFFQKGNDHLSGHGCKSCSKIVSKEENSLLEYIKTLLPLTTIKTSYRPSWLNKQELDIFIPHLNLALEYNGSIFHHSSTNLELNSFLRNTSKQKHYHHQKWLSCFNNNINLITVNDYLWLDIKYRDLIENIIQEVIKDSSGILKDNKHKVIDLDFYGHLLNNRNYVILEPIYKWVKISNPTIWYTETNKPYNDMEKHNFLKIYNNGLAFLK